MQGFVDIAPITDQKGDGILYDTGAVHSLPSLAFIYIYIGFNRVFIYLKISKIQTCKKTK